MSHDEDKSPRDHEEEAMSEQIGWLVESAIHDEKGPYYLCIGDVAGHYFEWRPDNNLALRFSRREDAERLIPAVRELCPQLFPQICPMPRAVEHGWADMPAETNLERRA